MKYLYQGLEGHHTLVPWIWAATVMNCTAFVLFLIPKTRENLFTLNLGSLLIIAGVWIEKGLGLIVPGFIPDPLGEIYEYMPNMTETVISFGIWAFGLLIFTLFMRIAVPIQRGDFIHSKYAKQTAKRSYEQIRP
jgi:Ni/Fe-hydrogenase subunit HybB-like protein